MPNSRAATGLARLAGLAAGHHHGHLIKLLGSFVILVIVVVVVWIAVSALTRRRRENRELRTMSGRQDPDPPPSSGAALAVDAEHLTKTYQMGKVEVRALDDVRVEIGTGAMACIMGKSGSGKSTLLRQLGLIDRPTGGRIWLHGQEVARLPEHQRSKLRLSQLGYVFQEYALLPELTAAENVYLPAMMAGRPGRDCRRRAAELLDLVGLAGRARHRPRELSGGEQQRVAIARALVNQPRVIFADEPTANLDSASAKTVMQTLRKLRDTLGVTVVFVSHDPDDGRYATQLIRLSDGRITEDQATPADPAGPEISHEISEVRP
jgi:putative ABC transport system ATP-binding protein